MKNLNIYFRSFLTAALFLVTVKLTAQTPLPQNFTVDSQTSLAVWNVPDTSGSSQLIEYILFMDGIQAGSTSDTVFDFGYFWYGSEHTAGIAAVYASGNSDTTEKTFTSTFLIPPVNPEADQFDDAVYLAWEHPFFPADPDSVPSNILAYNIYRNGDSIAQVLHPDTVFYDFDLEEGEYNYSLRAVYDLTPYGFNGQTAVSGPAGPLGIVIVFCCELPFFEMWNAGNFASQMWETYCDNWEVNNSDGNLAPAAVFRASDTLLNYACSIESMNLGQEELTEGIIYLDFDLKLEDISSNGTEIFKVYLYSEGVMNEVFSQSNTGSFSWKNYHLDISEHTLGNPDYMLLFTTEGADGSNIENWWLDNIHVYFVCPAPYDLTAEIHSDAVHLEWQSPDTLGSKALTGYYIFREKHNSGDWVLLNEIPVEDGFYIDQVSDTGIHKYAVEAVFEDCRSGPSNTVEVHLYLGVSENNKNEHIRIFPNPADEFVLLEADIRISEVKILDRLGKEVISLYNIHSHKIKLPTTDLPDGIYMITVKGKNTKRVDKLLIKHH